ncbi:Rad2 endonuclease, putative [Babesia bigemina]|uniref:Rad2 endonuclease, putative n=1 Tax=Babesia bigemina TaxID=5866 RepID=A0A061DAX7_BABBI|nr:Rad2 endonuclease, putative [Babesia bigemina]CDR94870.1 Rad2 endonuclease, putative [Babesia bigemina]|eukprot:XP_012767056.1 Rad2 endonuclease, putative [Babesia bigemina]
MGIKGLWDAVAAAGVSSRVEMLRGKKVAIDASFWIGHCIASETAERRGQDVYGVFFLRICYLLEKRIYPIFVFDGRTPGAKRRTLLLRNMSRAQRTRNLRLLAFKALAVQMKHLAKSGNDRVFKPSSFMKRKKGFSSKELRAIAADLEVVAEPSASEPVPALAIEDVVAESSPKEDKLFSSDDEFEDTPALDIAPIADVPAEGGPRRIDILTMPQSYKSLKMRARSGANVDLSSASGGNELDSSYFDVSSGSRSHGHGVGRSKRTIELPLDCSINPESYEQLPSDVRYQIMNQIKDAWMYDDRVNLLRHKSALNEFSNLQVESYLRDVEINREIEKIKRSLIRETMPSGALKSDCDVNFDQAKVEALEDEIHDYNVAEGKSRRKRRFLNDLSENMQPDLYNFAVAPNVKTEPVEVDDSLFLRDSEIFGDLVKSESEDEFEVTDERFPRKPVDDFEVLDETPAVLWSPKSIAGAIQQSSEIPGAASAIMDSCGVASEPSAIPSEDPTKDEIPHKCANGLLSDTGIETYPLYNDIVHEGTCMGTVASNPDSDEEQHNSSSHSPGYLSEASGDSDAGSKSLSDIGDDMSELGSDEALEISSSSESCDEPVPSSQKESIGSPEFDDEGWNIDDDEDVVSVATEGDTGIPPDDDEDVSPANVGSDAQDAPESAEQCHKESEDSSRISAEAANEDSAAADDATAASESIVASGPAPMYNNEWQYRDFLRMEKLFSHAERSTYRMDEWDKVPELLDLFGLPFLVAPSEAEAQCAHLNKIGLCFGVISDDSDTLAFGAKRVFKRFYSGQIFESYVSERVVRELGLGQEQIALLAIICGCDYTPGVRGIGVVNALEVIKAFPTFDELYEFRRWATSDVDLATVTDDPCPIKRAYKESHVNYRLHWSFSSDFPNREAYNLFLSPVVSSTFDPRWRAPRFEEVKRFMAKHSSLPESEVDTCLSKLRVKDNFEGYILEDFVPEIHAGSHRKGHRSLKSNRKILQERLSSFREFLSERERRKSKKARARQRPLRASGNSPPRVAFIRSKRMLASIESLKQRAQEERVTSP